MYQPAKHSYKFGPFRLEPCERRLLREAQPVPLTAKVFDLLLVLVQNHGHLLEKEELMRTRGLTASSKKATSRAASRPGARRWAKARANISRPCPSGAIVLSRRCASGWGGVGRAGTHPRQRNRIYARVFDREWVKANMPDAEVRWQRAAFRRGLLRATAVATVIIAAMAFLIWLALKQRNFAVEQQVANCRLL